MTSLTTLEQARLSARLERMRAGEMMTMKWTGNDYDDAPWSPPRCHFKPLVAQPVGRAARSPYTRPRESRVRMAALVTLALLTLVAVALYSATLVLGLALRRVWQRARGRR